MAFLNPISAPPKNKETGYSDSEVRDFVWKTIYENFNHVNNRKGERNILQNIVGSDYPDQNDRLGVGHSGNHTTGAPGHKDSVYFAGGGNDTVEAGNGGDLILGDMQVNQSIGYPYYWKWAISGYKDNVPSKEVWGSSNGTPVGLWGEIAYRIHNWSWDYKATVFHIKTGNDTLFGGGGNDSIFGFGG